MAMARQAEDKIISIVCSIIVPSSNNRFGSDQLHLSIKHDCLTAVSIQSTQNG
jgi:hypothetical protein